MTSVHTDMRATWPSILPRPLRILVRLGRFDRPVGIWLLLLPCWWSLALGGAGLAQAKLYALFALGAAFMRASGCVINDILDRNFDSRVARTATRPLASGEIGVPAALAFAAALMLGGLLVLLQFNRFAIALGAASLLLVFTYPLMKRITFWPQFFLGLAFNWGALLGWAVLFGRIDPPALLLYGAGIFWTLGYDTIYAHQDRVDDSALGLKSTALLFGDASRIFVAACFAASYLLLLASAGFSGRVAIALIPALAHLVWQVKTWRMSDPASSLACFKSNVVFGFLVLAAFLAGQIPG